MKKYLIPIILTVAIIAAGAVILTLKNGSEKPVPIESFIKESHTSDWYAHQADLWEQRINKKPNDDDAWINWFIATRNKIIFKNQESKKHSRRWQEEDMDFTPLKDIAARLANERPNSFARYYIDFRCSREINGYECEDNMEKAIAMRPDKAELYPNYVSYLLPKDNDELMKKILRKWYKSERFPNTFISYFYNSLAGMEPNGILIVNGDIPVYSTLLVQYGMNKFQDRTMICVSMLYLPEYRKKICRQLEIDQIDEPTVYDSKGLREWEQNVFTTIAQKTGRPLYFTSMMAEVPQYDLDFKSHLYSEGLVNKYSTVKYDNLAVKRRNFEEVYNTDYLYDKKKKSKDTYEAEEAVNLNYIPCFKSLLTYYRETGNQKQEAKLRELMTHIVDIYVNMSDDERKYYYDEIDR